MRVAISRATGFIVMILFICVSVPSQAQVRSQQSSIEKRMKVLNDKLKLSGDQFRKIKVIFEDQQEELGVAANENRGNKQALDDAIKDITLNTDVKIKVILNEKQSEIYNKMIEEREGKTDKQVIDSSGVKAQEGLK